MLGKQVLALGAVLGIVCSPISANAVEWTVGLGGGVAPDYEGSENYELVPLWNIRANDLYDPNTYVQVLGPKLNSNFLPHDNLRLGLSGQYVAERDDVENDQVDSLSSTDDGLMLGVLLGYDFKLSARGSDLRGGGNSDLVLALAVALWWADDLTWGDDLADRTPPPVRHSGPGAWMG